MNLIRMTPISVKKKYKFEMTKKKNEPKQKKKFWIFQLRNS